MKQMQKIRKPFHYFHSFCNPYRIQAQYYLCISAEQKRNDRYKSQPQGHCISQAFPGSVPDYFSSDFVHKVLLLISIVIITCNHDIKSQQYFLLQLVIGCSNRTFSFPCPRIFPGRLRRTLFRTGIPCRHARCARPDKFHLFSYRKYYLHRQTGGTGH